MRYCGHDSKTAWNVSLWIHNEYSLYCLAIDCIRSTKTKDEAAKLMLSKLPPETPDGHRYSFRTVRRALVGLRGNNDTPAGKTDQ